MIINSFTFFVKRMRSYFQGYLYFYEFDSIFFSIILYPSNEMQGRSKLKKYLRCSNIFLLFNLRMYII